MAAVIEFSRFTVIYQQSAISSDPVTTAAVNTFYFGQQKVRTRNYVVMRQEDEALDLLSLVAEANLGKLANIPEATAGRNADPWVDAETAGIPQREAPSQPWTPRQPLVPTPLPVP